MLYKKSAFHYVSIGLVLALFFNALSVSAALAFDVSVTEGSASIEKEDSITTITLNERSILEGMTSIAADEMVRIIGVSDLLLRDTSGQRTDLLGSLLAEGRLILVNQEGIFIAQNAHIDTASFIASTLDIKNSLFMAGDLRFEKLEGLSPKEISNQANITSKDGGFIVLLSDRIVNEGILKAKLGTVALASGEKISLSLDSQGTLNLIIDKGLSQEILDSNQNPKDLILNKGTLSANGGLVIVKAQQLEVSLQRVVNNEGLIEAGTAVEKNGGIELVSNRGIHNTGIIRSSQLTEEGSTFRSSGTLEVGRGRFDNLDGAADISGNISGAFQDTTNINLTGNVTLTGNTSLEADSDDNQSGKIIMNTNSITGGGYDLSLTTGEDDTLDGNITGVNLFTLNSSTTNNKTFTSTGTTFTVTTLKTNYYSLFSRSSGLGTGINGTRLR